MRSTLLPLFSFDWISLDHRCIPRGWIVRVGKPYSFRLAETYMVSHPAADNKVKRIFGLNSEFSSPDSCCFDPKSVAICYANCLAMTKRPTVSEALRTTVKTWESALKYRRRPSRSRFGGSSISADLHSLVDTLEERARFVRLCTLGATQSET